MISEIPVDQIPEPEIPEPETPAPEIETPVEGHDRVAPPPPPQPPERLPRKVGRPKKNPEEPKAPPKATPAPKAKPKPKPKPAGPTDRVAPPQAVAPQAITIGDLSNAELVAELINRRRANERSMRAELYKSWVM